jgi:hypothetical protein
VWTKLRNDCLQGRLRAFRSVNCKKDFHLHPSSKQRGKARATFTSMNEAEIL